MAPVVYTPVQGFTGTVVGVHFRDGVGETDDPAALGYFQSAGYRIDAPESGGEKGDPAKPADQPAEGTPADAPEGDGEANSGGDDAKTGDKGDAPKRPYPQANKAEWFAYLEKVKPGHGLTIENTKPELIAAVDAQ